MKKALRSVSLALFLLLLLGACAGHHEPVLILISRRGSGGDPDLMLSREVGVMKSMLNKAGYDVKVSSPLAEEIVGDKLSLKPDLKNRNVVLADYSGYMMPCLAQPFAAPGDDPVPEMVQAMAASGKPIAAQASAITVLSKAGLLKGAQLAAEPGSGVGVISDGNIITSTDCPYLEVWANGKDGTVELTRRFIAALGGHAPAPSAASASTRPVDATTAVSAELTTLAPPTHASSPYGGHDYFAVRDGMQIHLWQKCAIGKEADAAKAGKVILLIHGATWSGKTDFDLQIRDYSLMDFLCSKGYDAWAIDIHGYGQSDKTDKDWSDTASAALDTASAVDYICSLRQITRIDILGWSWGAMIAGVYVEKHPERVARLVLYGTVWKGSPDWKNQALPKTEYHTNGMADVRGDFVPGQFEPDVVSAYARAALQTDPRSPNGVLVDLATRLPIIDPAKIAVPTLVIRPEHDFATSPKK